MKAALEFDVENPDPEIAEREKEKMHCAAKGWAMSGFIDSFLDYLIVCAPHVPMGELKDKLLKMYYNKLEIYDVIDMLDTDLQEMVNDWVHDESVCEEADEQMNMLRDEYRQKRKEEGEK